MTPAEIFNLAGAVGGILGGILISFKRVEGFYVWLGGNTCWIVFGILVDPINWAIIAQFTFFQAISVNGIRQWGK